MGTYKVIQDIEAEDKLLGWLSLRQFIYAIIVVVSGFVAFRLALVNPLLALPLLPHTILFAVLASPFSKDQPSEVWLLAKIRFFLVPRKRIWDQSGLKELVTITAPKKIEKILVKDLSQTEVRSRLEALANTIDSRGWAVKNVNVNMFAQPSYVLGQVDSDRLIDPSTMAQEVPNYDIQATDDMLDPASNPQAQLLDQMIATSSQVHKQQLIQNMHKSNSPGQQGAPTDYWFLSEPPAQSQTPGFATFNKSQLVQPGQHDNSQTTTKNPSSPDEAALLEKIHAEKAKPNPYKSHLRNIKPIAEQQAENNSHKAKKSISHPDTAGLPFNNDLSVETIARQVNKKPKKDDDGEVVISLR